MLFTPYLPETKKNNRFLETNDDCCASLNFDLDQSSLLLTKSSNSDAGAEEAQRKALALRCREWEETCGGDESASPPKAGSGVRSTVSEAFFPGVGSSRVAAAKRAALPCLRNLASFVANQGRHVDAEVVLVSEEQVESLLML